jgi:Domain of unknown function (DUF4173)
MQAVNHDVLFSDLEGPDRIGGGARTQNEPPIGSDHYTRSIASSVAMMVGAYYLWAQDYGNTGFAIFLFASAVLVVWNLSMTPGDSHRYGVRWRVSLLSLGLLLVCLRLVWQPNVVACLAAILFWLAIAMVSQSRRSCSWQLILFPFRIAWNGVLRWLDSPWTRLFNGMSKNRLAWLSWGVPLLAGILFLFPLIQSHPEMASNLGLLIRQWVDAIWDYAKQMSPVTALLVALVGILSLGVLLPRFAADDGSGATHPPLQTDAVCSWIAYLASRNTLIVVSCIFVWFLAIEIRATWFREFPEGFIYSTYAHQGAAWLTVALAMSTAAMSILFRPEMHQHPRIATLQRLAWFWSLCNVLLVIAVFYRLLIYVQFNGMTRMRIVGFVGVACVFTGFVIVNSRIMGQRSIASILHKQCWALVWSVYVLALLPMDSISHGWNCSRIRSGQLAPAVQLAVQTISDEGLLCIIPLVESEETEIRDGVSALLAQRYSLIQIQLSEPWSQHTERSIRWTQFQGSRFLLEQRLNSIVDHLQPFLESPQKRHAAITSFRDWTKPWY